MRPPTSRAATARNTALLLLLPLLSIALVHLGLEPRSQAAESGEGAPIDWERARELHRRVQRGETLTPEEKAYYERAMQLRRERRRGSERAPGAAARSREPRRESQRTTTAGTAPAVPRPGAVRDRPLPAFPGAEGDGAGSEGGRGGRVAHVTNLADRGPGSLRAAVESPGRRTVVFDVGGTIQLSEPLLVDRPFITIAGQTAPGGGIALKGSASMDGPLIRVRSHDVVVRYLRIRPGPGAPGSTMASGVGIAAARGVGDVIFDHVSISWAVDKALVIFAAARNVTVQWSILAETLYCSNHGKTVDWRVHGTPGPCPAGGVPHSRAVTVSSMPPGPIPGDISLHHNLLAHNNMRHPNVVSAGPVSFVNNVIYNLGELGANLGYKPGAAYGAALDYVGNFIKPGPNTDPEVTAVSAPGFVTEGISVYVDGNLGTDAIRGPFPPRFESLGFLSDRRTANAAVTETSAREAYDAVLAGAGASLPSRDAVDLRILADVAAGTGGYVNDPAEVGGWPRLDPGSPPVDRDRDGMPADWESRCPFLDDGDPADTRADHDGDGYTELEEYLNCLAADGGLAAAATGCSCNPPAGRIDDAKTPH